MDELPWFEIIDFVRNPAAGASETAAKGERIHLRDIYR
jgi:hypothetical protein